MVRWGLWSPGSGKQLVSTALLSALLTDWLCVCSPKQLSFRCQLWSYGFQRCWPGNGYTRELVGITGTKDIFFRKMEQLSNLLFFFNIKLLSFSRYLSKYLSKKFWPLSKPCKPGRNQTKILCCTWEANQQQHWYLPSYCSSFCRKKNNIFQIYMSVSKEFWKCFQKYLSLFQLSLFSK